MNNCLNRSNARRVLFSVLVAIAMIPVGACSGTVERHWSEEVSLDDGTVIVIDRYVKFRETNSLAGDAYGSTDLKSTLAFVGDLSKLPSWDVPLFPLVLYRDERSGEWVVVATSSNCEVWEERGSPKPPYWEYRLKSDKWVQSSLSEMSLDRKTNLFFNYEPNLPAGKLSLDLKDQIIKHNDFAKDYLSIRRDAKTNCM